MSNCICKINNPEYKTKMAGFDFDWTLVNPKEDRNIPKDVDDWEWYHPSIPDKMKLLVELDYMIVIFTNQSKTWKHEQIKNVMTSLNIDCFIVIATKKNIYKPNAELYNNFIKEYEMKYKKKFEIDKTKSFYVGDALGRKTDFSDSDAQFALNIGIDYLSPEEYFNIKYEFDKESIDNGEKLKINELKQYLIIMIGYPGSGKSSIANYIKNENTNFKIISGDTYKTESKMKKQCKLELQNKHSVIIDATNSSNKKREMFINIAKEHNISNDNIYLIEINCGLNDAYKRNKTRPSNFQIPRIAYNVYKKYYQKNNISELKYLLL